MHISPRSPCQPRAPRGTGMGRTVGSRRGLPCSEAVKRDVQREQLPCCTLLPTGPCFCAWIADVLLQLCGTNEPLPAPAPPQAQGTGAHPGLGHCPLCRLSADWGLRPGKADSGKPVAGILGSLAWCRRGSAACAVHGSDAGPCPWAVCHRGLFNLLCNNITVFNLFILITLL